MAVNLYRIPGTRIFVNSLPEDGNGRATNASFCFYHEPTTALPLITFKASQSVKGAYAFMPANAASPFDVLERVMATAAQSDGRFLLWMNEDWSATQNELLIRNSATVNPLELTHWNFDALPDASPGRAKIGFRVPAGTAVAFSEDDIALSHAGLQLVTSIDTAIYRMNPSGDTVRLVLECGSRCAAFEGELPAQDTSKLMAAIAPHVRYRWKPNSLSKTKHARLLSAHDADHRDVTAKFELNRYAPDRTHSRIRLLSTSANSYLLSTSSDTAGHMIELCPDNEAAVYFETKPGGNTYACLLGRFAVKSIASTHVVGVGPTFREVMPGSVGTEFFQLDKDGFNGLEFFPGQPAFVKFGNGSRPPMISDDLRTAWIAPCRTGETLAFSSAGYSFVAKPQDQPLYGQRDIADINQNTHPSTVLFDPAPLAVDPTACLPFFPFRGIRKGTVAETQRLDKEALAPIRSERASKSRSQSRNPLSGLNEAGASWITTPLGLLVEIDSPNNWRTIKLGESESGDWKLSINRPNDVGGHPVERWALQEALSRSEVFVVVTKQEGDIPDPADPPFGTIELSVNIGGWPMKTRFADTGMVKNKKDDPPVDNRSKYPVLIVKLSKGPLATMLGDVGRWSLAKIFNNDPQTASAGAVKALENLFLLNRGYSPLAKDNAPEQYKKIAPELVPHYKDLYEKIVDDNWTGVLIMNAHTPFKEVPDEVSVVTEGEESIDRFAVPVLGIDVNRVMPNMGSMKLEKTSAFGAIHYHSPEPLEEDGDFEFKLRTLNAVFGNSELRTFLASMQLRLSEFSAQSRPPGRRGATHGCWTSWAGTKASPLWARRRTTPFALSDSAACVSRTTISCPT